jgi:hypothetical protein
METIGFDEQEVNETQGMEISASETGCSTPRPTDQ